jgi:hypothetical protein
MGNVLFFSHVLGPGAGFGTHGLSRLPGHLLKAPATGRAGQSVAGHSFSIVTSTRHFPAVFRREALLVRLSPKVLLLKLNSSVWNTWMKVRSKASQHPVATCRSSLKLGSWVSLP